MDYTQEIWKDAPDINGIKVSSFGRVMGRTGKILSQRKGSSPYFLFCTKVNGIRKSILTHRVVATAFVPNPHNLPTVNHKNSNKDDNSAQNLEWCSYSDNLKHSHLTGNRNHFKRKVEMIKDGVVIKVYDSILSTKQDFKNYSLIGRAVSGKYKNKTAYGYNWKYHENIH